MEQELPQGQLVTLDSSAGRIARVVVRDMGEVVLVCREEEYLEAQREGREPISIGFRRQDVVK